MSDSAIYQLAYSDLRSRFIQQHKGVHRDEAKTLEQMFQAARDFFGEHGYEVARKRGTSKRRRK